MSEITPESPVSSSQEPVQKAASFMFALRGAALAWLAFQVFGLGAVLIVSRLLDPAEYGRLGVALSISVYAFYVCQWGIDPLLTRNLVRANADEARQQLAAFYRQKQLISFVVVLLAAASIPFLKPELKILAALGVVYGIVQGFTAAAAFDARGKIGTYTSFGALRQLIYFFAVFAAWRSISSPNAMMVLTAGIAAICIQLCLEWVWLRKDYGKPDWSNATRDGLKLWRDSAELAIAFLAMQIPNYFGPPLLEFFGSKTHLGQLVLSNQLTIVTISFWGLASRKIHAQLSAVNDPFSADFSRKTWLSTFSLTVAGVAVATALTFVIPWVMLIFPQSYGDAAEIFRFDIWRVVGALASNVLGSALICRHQLRGYMICHILALVVSAALAAMLIGPYDAKGVVVATAIGRAAFAVFAVPVLLYGKKANA